MSNQLAILEYVHLCKPQYKSTAVDELLISCFNTDCYGNLYELTFDTKSLLIESHVLSQSPVQIFRSHFIY